MRGKLIFIGSFVPSRLCLEDQRFSQASNTFQNKFADLVGASLIISVVPVFYRGNAFDSNQKKFTIIEGFDLIPGKLNYAFRVLFDLIRILKVLAKRSEKIVIFYNIEVQTITPIILLMLLPNIKVYIIAADITWKGDGFFGKICKFVYRNVDGVFSLSQGLALNKNSVVMPGVVLDKLVVLKDHLFHNPEVILSGSLGYTTGLLLALETFATMGDVKLHITGRPFGMSEKELIDLVSKYSSVNKNIVFHGMLPLDEYSKLLGKSDIALSLRNPSDKEHAFNFPSKIIEYLCDSKLVISTIEYQEIPPGILFCCKYDANSLRSLLMKLINFTDEQVLQYRRYIYSYVNADLSESAFAKNINRLIYE
jgi:glycosyltransferase involved in cell wall biosynthesis